MSRTTMSRITSPTAPSRGTTSRTATRTTTRAAAAGMALAAALTLGACGSDAAPATGSSSSNEAAGATIDGEELANRVVAAMEKAGSGTMSMTGGGSTTSGAFRITDGSFEQQMSTEANGQKLDIVSSDGVIYIKGVPGVDAAKPWIKIDPAGDDPLSKMMGSMTGNLDISDPRSMTKAFAGSTATVVSSDDDGTTYSFSVKASDLVGPDLAQAAGDEEVEVTYTLDGEDRPVKSETSIAGQSTSITYADWGSDVSVEAPDADQIGTFEMPGLPSS